MGWIEYDAAIATIADCYVTDTDLQRFDQWRAALPPEWQALIVGPSPAVVNGYLSWAFLPDGSKSGWEDDERGEVLRREFAAFFGRGSVVEVHFGGDLRGEDPNVKAGYINESEDDEDD